nr:TetR/AcrR family transcriptional regulator [Tessaracoccus sp. OS52]
MPPEQRRAAIVEAALPLLAKHGPELTTRMVAEAAGVAEGTLFRAFPTLQELLAATYSAYLSGERLAERLAEVDPGDTLEATTSAALGALADYIESVHFALRPPPKQQGDTAPHLRQAKSDYLARMSDVRDWLVRILSPHTAELKISPESYAHFLMTLSIGQHMGRPAGIQIDDITDFALNGARRRTTA